MTFIKKVGNSLHGAVRKQLEHEFIRFCMVGIVGFCVNLSVLVLLRDALHAPIVLAVLGGGEAALVSNFLFHNFWTYRTRQQDKKISTLFFQFHIAFWSGNGINALLTLVMITQLGWGATVSLAIASIVVLFWNFIWTRYFIWRSKSVVAEEAKD